MKSTDEWIKKMFYIYIVCIYNGILLRNKKRNKSAICKSMDVLGGIMLSKIS